MNRAGLVTALTTSLLVAQLAAEAQAPAKAPRIGFLTALSIMSARTEAFRQGLRELGYVEGQMTVPPGPHRPTGWRPR